MRTAYIGMGGNLPSLAGAPEATLAAAAVRLKSLGRVTRRSSLYSTEPVGFADQPRFVNAVVALETELEPRALLEFAQARHPVVDLRVFRDRTYATGVFLMTILGFVLYGSLVLLPIWLQTLLG